MAIAIYARKSIERENSVSCETQIEHCKAMIKPDERDDKVITFVDNGFSGGNTDRDGFKKMMRQIAKGKITKVIVYRLDRISRSLADFVNILNVFKEHSVEFVSAQEAFDTSSPYGELIVKILAVFAEFERNSIIERVSQAYDHRSTLGFYMGGRRPYGFELVPTVINSIKTKRLEAKNDEVEQIRYIYNTYAVENVTLRRLQKNLVENGILPLDGGDWTTAKLSTILKNPIYVRADSNVYEYYQKKNANIIGGPEGFDGVHGLQLYGLSKHSNSSVDWADIKVVVMQHEGLIDSDTWLKCQRKIIKNKQVGRAAGNKTSWLGGLVVCRKCGSTMTTIKSAVTSDEVRRYFNCTGRSHKYKCKGPNSTVYAKSLEDMVYDEIALKLEEIKGTKKPKAIPPILNELRNKLKAVELEEEKLTEIIVKDDVNSDLLAILGKKATALKQRKVEILEKIEEVQANEVDVKRAVNLSKKWQTASFDEKKGVASVLIDKIYIETDGNVEIVWNI